MEIPAEHKDQITSTLRDLGISHPLLWVERLEAQFNGQYTAELFWKTPEPPKEASTLSIACPSEVVRLRGGFLLFPVVELDEENALGVGLKPSWVAVTPKQWANCFLVTRA